MRSVPNAQINDRLPDDPAFLRRISLQFGPADANQLLRMAEEIERWRANAESYPFRRAS